MYKIWKSWIVIQRTGQMTETEASVWEELWDMRCIFKYLHLATTLLSSSWTCTESYQVAQQLLSCETEIPHTFLYEKYVPLSIIKCITE